VILVIKIDVPFRICVDYRELNMIIIKDKFSIPVIEELLDKLNMIVFFTQLHLRSGYRQIPLRDENTHKISFRMHEGNYEFLVMPFGLIIFPSTF